MAQLLDLGYRVIEGENGEAAIGILDREGAAVDLLFTDIIMGGNPDGYALARLAVERISAIKVLPASGFPGMDFENNPNRNSDWRLLSKPYRKSDLAQAIGAELDNEAPAAVDSAPTETRRHVHGIGT